MSIDRGSGLVIGVRKDWEWLQNLLTEVGFEPDTDEFYSQQDALSDLVQEYGDCIVGDIYYIVGESIFFAWADDSLDDEQQSDMRNLMALGADGLKKRWLDALMVSDVDPRLIPVLAKVADEEWTYHAVSIVS